MSCVGVLQVFILVLTVAKAQFVFPNENKSGEKFLREKARALAQNQGKTAESYKLILSVSFFNLLIMTDFNTSFIF